MDRFANQYAITWGFCSVVYMLSFVVNHLLAPKLQMLGSRALT